MSLFNVEYLNCENRLIQRQLSEMFKSVPSSEHQKKKSQEHTIVTYSFFVHNAYTQSQPMRYAPTHQARSKQHLEQRSIGSQSTKLADDQHRGRQIQTIIAISIIGCYSSLTLQLPPNSKLAPVTLTSDDSVSVVLQRPQSSAPKSPKSHS